MRILHLVDHADGSTDPATLALLATTLGRLGPHEQQVLLLGGAELEAHARAVGINDLARQGVLLGHAWMGALNLPRWLEREGWQNPDLVHCWSASTLTLAALRLRGIPRVCTFTHLPTTRQTHWLRLLTSEAGNTTLLPTSATIRRELLAGGVPEALTHVLRPGLDFARVEQRQRAALRQQWEVPDDAFVIALLGDPPHAQDAVAAMFCVGLTIASLPTARRQRVHLLLHPRQRGRERCRELDRPLGRDDVVIADAKVALPWSVLPGCDAVLMLGDHGGGLSLLWALAGNVPVVGAATYAISEVLEDRHSALLFKPHDLHAGAERLVRLIEDQQLAWKLRDAARNEAFSYFSRQRYCTSLQAIYEQAQAGQAITVPDLPITGGLRFAGRA